MKRRILIVGGGYAGAICANRLAKKTRAPDTEIVLADPRRNGPKQVDIMLKLMMDEGPGGGHYDNIMSAKLRRIGVGLVYVNARFYMTNDFSD